MSYSLKLRHEATKEFTEALIWYEEQQVGLAKQFQVAIEAKIKQVCKNPYLFKYSYRNYHEALTDKFPFLIIYTINEKERQVVVFAIFHTSRNPNRKYTVKR